MNLRARVAAVAVGIGVTLLALGVLHVALGMPALQRAVARGDLAPRLAGPQMVNWLFSGAAMSLVGVLLAWSAPDLRRGRHRAWRSALFTGLFFAAVGVTAYLWVPRPSVLVFTAIGLILAAPLLLTRRHFRED